MKKVLLLLSLVFCFGITSLTAKVKIPADDSQIVYTGRINFSNPKSPLFVYPGTTIKANFTGKSIDMLAKPGSGYFMVTIDNNDPKKIYFGTNDSIISIGSNLNNGNHSAEIMLVYEGYKAKPEFRGFMLDDSAKLLAAPLLPERKIEFIGNSITCGYGNEAQSGKDPFRDSTENHYYTYAAIISRSFNAQHMVVARSGIGVYRNYNGRYEGDENIMPRWYDYTNLYDNSQKWDSKRYTPDLICINLGTNDLSTTPYDLKHYQTNYENFVKHLKSLYPNAKIVMLTGSMLQGAALQDQLTALNSALSNLSKEGFTDIYRFDMSVQDGSLGYGASYHPSKQQHAKMAQELMPYLKKIMNW